MTQLHPEPGEVGDPNLGLPGPAEPLPEDHHLIDVPTEINDEEDDDDDLDEAEAGAADH